MKKATKTVKTSIVQSITSWRTTLIGIILLLVSTAIWFIPDMPKDLKPTVSLMLTAASLAAFGIKDETVFGKNINVKD